ncbi:MAG: acetyl-CoA carboxylase biotin carboxylase subunit [Ardenticatenaceae bacterium]|nr:acetyl-CoA carboxylase biotin carboxylase subunit [Ardenticatenaceae bacterium]HBY98240.1 acetyl-CoA carboxylase biotin carboxylase subunit [Chloroflexota bacterium]
MFRKVLIANRGEIAVRIVRACQELGLETVAVYSDADRKALHVRYADEAYRIGPPTSSESYLRIDKLIDVAIRARVDAIHPGYGFLAENATFARAVAEAGLIFVGPSPAAISLMGDKVAARQTAMQAGAPTVPGSARDLDDAGLIAAAAEIGYPVMVKAAAGGGGKGMRTVRTPDELPGSLAAARREARGAFGDDRIYLEKLIENARHIEIQILGDQYGNLIHLGERECSIQRRHQKLVEEAPSPFADPALREKMGALAVRVARAANYANAGTVEFLVDRDKNFYFLEMNTRLQVEHPVTEMVTGVDIVKEQLRIASGRKLRYSQEEIKLSGHAIEARITAEDPYNGFLPSTGTITSLVEPNGPSVRVENGIYEGYEVSLFYDPLIAKLVVWGETRGDAILRLRRALQEYRILGIRTNIPFHRRLLDNTNFIGGVYGTDFLAANPDLMTGFQSRNQAAAAIAATILFHRRRQQALVHTTGDQPSLWKAVARREVLR